MLPMISCEHGRSNYLKSCRPPRGPDQPQQPLSSLPTTTAAALATAPYELTLISVQGPTRSLAPTPHLHPPPFRTDDTVSLSRPVTGRRHRRLKNGFSLAGALIGGAARTAEATLMDCEARGCYLAAPPLPPPPPPPPHNATLSPQSLLAGPNHGSLSVVWMSPESDED